MIYIYVCIYDDDDDFLVVLFCFFVLFCLVWFWLVGWLGSFSIPIPRSGHIHHYSQLHYSSIWGFP